MDESEVEKIKDTITNICECFYDPSYHYNGHFKHINIYCKLANITTYIGGCNQHV